MKRSVWMSTRKTHKIYAIPCHCPACIRQYVDEEDQEELIAAYHGYLPLDEVSKLSASSVKAIEVDQEYLRSCIKTHQTKILKSWQKSKAKRTMVLREAEPGICPNGNTTIDLGITTPLFTGTETQEPYRKTFMLPYFNLQDLANDYSLFISLLHHRACSSPADWAAFDNAIIEKFWIQHRFKEAFAKGNVHLGRQTYGQVGTEQPLEIHHGFSYGAPRALQILEAQAHLLASLRKVTEIILGDIVPTALETDDNRHVAQKPLIYSPMDIVDVDGVQDLRSNQRFWTNSDPIQDLSSRWQHCLEKNAFQAAHTDSFGAFFSQLPFSSPPAFDLHAMHAIIKNHTFEKLDELWLLQTDPEYFHEYLTFSDKHWYDNQPQFAHMKRLNTVNKPNQIAVEVTLVNIQHARNWFWLLEDCTRAITCNSRMRDSETQNTKAEGLRSLQEAVASVQQHLCRTKGAAQERLYKHILLASEFQHIFSITQDRGFGFAALSAHGEQDVYRDDPLAWCLLELGTSTQHRTISTHSVILQRLDRLMSNDPKAARRINPVIFRLVSDISVLEKLLFLCDLQRPRFAFLDEATLSTKFRSWEFLEHISRGPGFFWSLEVPLGSDVTPYSKYNVPRGKRDDIWLEERDRAHENLRNLWKKARVGYETKLLGMGVPRYLVDPHLEMMKYSETPTHLRQMRKEKAQVLRDLNKEAQKGANYIPFPEPGPEQKRTEKTLGGPHGTAKVKTRPFGANDKLETITDFRDTPGSQTPPILYTIKDGSMSWNAISTMFPMPGDHDILGSLSWRELSNTMVELGFCLESSGGSAFTFSGDVFLPSKPKERQKASINIHRPHPDAMFSLIQLRGIGKRLNRRFGWEKANFGMTEG